MQDDAWTDSLDADIPYVELKNQFLATDPKDKKKSQNQSGSIAGKILYLMGCMVGILGSYFTLRSLRANDSDMRDRVLYSMMLLLSGVLVEAAKTLESDSQRASSDIDKNKKFAVSIKTKELNQKIVNDKKVSSALDSDIKAVKNEISSLEIDPVEMAAIDTQSVNVSQPIVRSSSSSIIWRRILNNILDFIPTTWFTQSLILFIRNAIQENLSAALFPYTTIIGLSTGYLFHVSIKPWSLRGLRDWIQRDQMGLSLPELISLIFLPLTNRINVVFYITSASFWTGYSLNDLTVTIFGKLFSIIKGINRNDKNFVDIIPENYFPLSINHRQNLFIFISGSALLSSSLILLKYITEDSVGWRNISVQLLGTAGCYAITYPFGLYLGHYIPLRYHANILVACTYLLIPFAAPELSILHFLMMMGGGLSGGIGSYIINARYHNRITTMKLRLEAIRQLIIEQPALFRQLIDLPLPPDQLLMNKRKQHRGSRWVANLTGLIGVVLALRKVSWQYSTVISGSFTLIGTILAYNWLMPRWSPSNYSTYKLPYHLRLFYLDSFTPIFIFKIGVFLFLKVLLDPSNKYTDFNHPTPVAVFVSNIVSIGTPFVVSKTLYKKVFGKFSPYCPSLQAIEKLAILTKPELLTQQTQPAEDSRVPSLKLSYHLLKFMQENQQQLFEDEVKSKPQDVISSIEEKNQHNTDKLNHPFCQHPYSGLRLFLFHQMHLPLPRTKIYHYHPL